MKAGVLLVLGIFYSISGMAQDTILKLYRPFGDEEVLKPVIIKKLKGQCEMQSKLIAREDAWRCQVDEQVFDPCFVKSGPKETDLLCPTSPWSRDNVQIQVAAPLNNEAHQTLDMSRTFPWAIELVNGAHCLAVDQGGIYDSMPIRYHCSSNAVLFGSIQRCNPVWSILEKRSEEVVTSDLKKAWF